MPLKRSRPKPPMPFDRAMLILLAYVVDGASIRRADRAARAATASRDRAAESLRAQAALLDAPPAQPRSARRA